MASVEFCKIPPFPWPSMASMVAWTSIESIGWITWKWSPIAPWISQKLSVESMETYRKRSKLMPLNYALSFHCFLEVHGNGVQILHGSGSGIHGIPWISQRREWFSKCMYYQMYFEWPESKSILVFVKFLYGISLSQNIFFYCKELLHGSQIINFLISESQIIFFENLQSPPPPWVSNGPPLIPGCNTCICTYIHIYIIYIASRKYDMVIEHKPAVIWHGHWYDMVIEHKPAVKIAGPIRRISHTTIAAFLVW